MKLHPDELATILAALRLYQRSGMAEPANQPLWLHEIASDGGAISLDDGAIDILCTRINVEGRKHEPRS